MRNINFNNLQHQRVLTLSGKKNGDTEAKELAEVLNKNTSLQTLYLNGNNLTKNEKYSK